MNITLPENLTLQDWSSQVIMDLQIPVHQLTGEDWQVWGEQFVLDPTLGSYNIPSPFEFEEWQEWANRFCGVLS